MASKPTEKHCLYLGYEVGMLCLRSYDNNIFMKVLSVLFKALQK